MPPLLCSPLLAVALATGLAQAQGLPPEPAPDCVDQACPAPRWEAPRLAGAYDMLPGEHRPFQVVVDPISWNTGAWNLGPVVAVTAPVVLDDGLELDAWHLQLGTWWMPVAESVRWRVGPEIGLCLRSFAREDQELLRDWLPAVGARVGMSWLLFERWRVEPGLRLVGELPPTELLLLDGMETLPTWRLQVLLGIHLPTPGR